MGEDFVRVPEAFFSGVTATDENEIGSHFLTTFEPIVLTFWRWKNVSPQFKVKIIWEFFHVIRELRGEMLVFLALQAFRDTNGSGSDIGGVHIASNSVAAAAHFGFR